MHLKFRPTTMDEVVGLDYIKNALERFEFDVPVMFHGERGCGKTTFAEILAKEFCEDEFTLNIRTINCGYYTKIDDMRAEIDRLHVSSLFGKNKVLILDEIHRLSNASQNAWLIPLEKLPENVLVLACTTEPNKIIPTLLRRFVQYKVHRLGPVDARILIDKVLAKENISMPKWAKIKVIEQTDCIPGLIMTALPKIIGITDEAKVDYLLEVVTMEQDADVLEILKQILGSTGWSAVKEALKVALKETKPESVRMSLMNLISGRMMSNFATDGNELIRLCDFYDGLQEAEGYPEKANLINAIFKAFYNFRKVGGKYL